MPNYSYFLSGDPDDVLFQTIEIRHPAFEHYHRFVANKADGLYVPVETQDEAGNLITEQLFYEYAPLEIKLGESNESLDQYIDVTIGDLGDILPAEIEAIRNSEYTPMQKPEVIYCEYLASNLAEPSLVISNLEISEYRMKSGMAIFKCEVKKLNARKTGVTYNLKDFPIMRGL